MKFNKLLPISVLTLCISIISLNLYGQTPIEKNKIISSYNHSYLSDFASKALEESERKKNHAVNYVQARNLPISYTDDTGSFLELQEVTSDGILIYYKTNNVNAALSTRTNHLNIGGLTGYNLDGQNMVAYVWDGGHPRETHQEYDGPGGNNRVTIMDAATEGGVNLNFHAAHVVGTIAASGVDPNAKGMAPQSTIKAYKWTQDLQEAILAASQGMLISNHSYGFDNSILPAYFFGSYMDYAEEWDELMFNTPYYLMVASAGNDGNNTYYNSQPLAPGYDLLSGNKTAKNNLVVANAQDATVDSNGNLIAVTINSSSSPGPTDDLRIKPDIAGNGTLVYSTFESFDNSYNTLSGTSMAAPNVTGSLLLLQQHYNNLYNTYMRASTLKGLAMHTADDAGPIGPDAKFGWGLLNAKRAAETITQNGTESIINELVLNQGQTITLQVTADGIHDLMASISWTDRPGAINNVLNSSTPALVNDLDLRISKDGNTFYPWRLTSATTNSNSGDNQVDPFERIEVANASGVYTITISHKGTLVGGNQAFSLIVTGIQNNCLSATAPQNLNANDITDDSVVISWLSATGATHDLRYKKSTDSTWTDVNNILLNSYTITGLDVYTQYDVEVRSKCDSTAPSAYTLLNFTTTGKTYCSSYSNSLPTLNYISEVTFNTINNGSGPSTYSDFTYLNTELVIGNTYTISLYTTGTQNYLATYAVWIDYNNDGVFDSSERVFTDVGVANTPSTGTITIPTIVNPIRTTMRVSMISDVEFPGPCQEISYGEVEDYAVFFIHDSTCLPPSALTATNILDEEVTVNWTPGGSETAWRVAWGLPGFTPENNEIGMENVNSTFYQITNLTPETNYEFYVQAVCSTEGITWAGPVSFLTLPKRPDNDDCINATPISCGDTLTGSVLDATKSSLPNPSCDSANSGSSLEDVFFSLDVEENYTYTISVNGINYDAILVLYSGTCDGLLEIACQDASFDLGGMETITYTATASETLIIRTYNYLSGFGDYTISVSCEYDGFVYDNGVWTPGDPNVLATATDNILVRNGETTFSNDIEVNDIHIESGATLKVEGVLTINGNIENEGNLVFVSTATRNGELAAVPATSTITGEVTVQRYAQNRRSYRMISSAVTTTTSIHENWQEGATSSTHNPEMGFGTHITGSTIDQLNGFDKTTTGNPSLFTLDVPGQKFDAIDNTDVNTLTAGEPYLIFIRGGRDVDLTSNNSSSETVLRATGTLLTGSTTQSFPDAVDQDFIMFGNPYQSAVDLNSVFAKSVNLNTNYFYLYDPALGDHGAYHTVDLINTPSTTLAYLQPGQAAQVKVTGPATIVFDESDKAPGNFTARNRPIDGHNMLMVALFTTDNFNNQGPIHDRFSIFFDGANSNLLTEKDAIKPMNFYENIGVNHNGTYLSVESRELPQIGEMYQVFTAGYTHTHYTLKINKNGLENYVMYLDDHYTGTSTLIEAGQNTYAFSVTNEDALSLANDRFVIRTEQLLDDNSHTLLDGIHLYPNPLHSETFFIYAPGCNGKAMNITINDISGRSIYEQKVTSSEDVISVTLDENIASGVYLITLNVENETQTVRLLKE